MTTTWRYIEDDGNGAAQGLAADEHLMHAILDSSAAPVALRLYTYRNHCALVGRFQHLQAELNIDACQRENIPFSRRLTGGGAIIMGEGQLGVCLTARADTFEALNTRQLYELLSAPLCLALKEMGINAGLRGKNDLETNGRKIAGLGIYADPSGALLFHASLLVDLDIPLMLRVLNIPLQKIGDKSNIQKVEQRITTVSRLLERQVPIDEVRQLIRERYAQQFGVHLAPQAFSAAENAAIARRATDKYEHPDWVFQHSPQPDMTGMGLCKTPAGLLRTYVALKGETIKSVLITGDFMGLDNLFRHIEAQLKWSPLDPGRMETMVQQAFEQYPQASDITPKETFQAIWRAALGAMKEVQYNYRGSCYYPQTQTTAL